MKFGVLADRWRNTPAWRQRIFEAMEWAERWFWRRLWLAWIRPHLRPRTHAREWYESRIHFRAPPVIRAYVWQVEDGAIGVTRSDFVVPTAWTNLCCFQGDTAEECRASLAEFIADEVKDAGTLLEGHRIEWYDFDPEPEDRPTPDSENQKP